MPLLGDGSRLLHPGLLLGTSDRYTPVELPGDRELLGRLVTVTAGPVVAGRIRADEASPLGG
jgi:hypothetical protein